MIRLFNSSPVKSAAAEDRYIDKAMSYEGLLKANHLDADSIIKEVAQKC